MCLTYGVRSIATTEERINAQGGLILVGKLLAKACDLPHLLSAAPSSLNQHFSHGDIVRTAVGLLIQGLICDNTVSSNI